MKCFCFLQYAAKEYQQALDILDMEEAASKKLLDKNLKEENGSREIVKDWEMSPASVSPTLVFFFLAPRLIRNGASFSELRNKRSN